MTLESRWPCVSRDYSVDDAVDREGRVVELVDFFDRLVVSLEDLVVRGAGRAAVDAVLDVFFAGLDRSGALGRALASEVVGALLLEASHVPEPLVFGLREDALFAQ